jgi:hypothetical protein
MNKEREREREREGEKKRGKREENHAVYTINITHGILYVYTIIICTSMLMILTFNY